MASIAIGAPMILSSQRLLRTAGIHADRAALASTRAAGVREIVAAYVILARHRRHVGVWTRARGDVIDLALLSAALVGRRENTARLLAALTAAPGIFATDLAVARRFSEPSV
jgi:hypothetical protein